MSVWNSSASEMRLTTHEKDWQEMAKLDPLWAILSAPEKQYNRWDYRAFFQTGEREVAVLVAEARELGYPVRWGRALDFGCGIGRVTRALHTYFPECYGVDISSEMVRRAHEFAPGCHFHVNKEMNLRVFDDSYFDLIYSVIVLQHQPNRAVALAYVSELVRVLGRDGLLVFQLPSYIPVRNRIQGRRRVYTLLHKMGCNSNFLYRSLRLTPIRMVYAPEKEVLAVVRSSGGRVLNVRPDDRAGCPCESRTYYVSR
jgi:SAM-dependent methyltransferase